MSLSTVATREPAVGFEPPVTSARTRDFVARSLEQWAGDERILMLTVPAPAAPAEILLRRPAPAMGLLWDPPTERTFAGLGAVHRIDVSGSDRFTDLRRRAGDLWPRLVTESAPGVIAPSRPRLFGGLAFDVGAASRELWSDFGDGCFTLPRFLYERRGEEAFLSLAVSGREAERGRDRFIDELEALTAELELGAVTLGQLPRVESIETSNGDWTEEIEAIRAAIGAGEVEKIVAARRSRVEFAAPLDTVDVLLRLARGLRASTRFAFCRERSTFLGATPERLIALAGLELETEALAGSIATGAEQATQLLESGKDQHEHQLVVDAIVRRLEPLCSRFTVAAAPRVRELREVLHLHTPIRGTLCRPRHVLELVEKIHPTPAVGGVPTDRALSWIAGHEPDERGWYAAPVGWFDAAGDGEFAVALRSCMMAGHEAYLYAGAGIMGDSDPELERRETELKKQALLRALGAD